jgi:hypothetical protein
MNTEQQLYVWLLEDEHTSTVFVGYDHVRKTTKSYTSTNASNIQSLAEKLCAQHNAEIIRNFTATIFAS